MRVCKDCKQEKALTEYAKGRTYKEGHTPVCKACDSARVSAKRSQLKNRTDAEVEAARTAVGPTKHCPRCQEARPVEQWGRDRGKADGYTYVCRPCAALAQSELRERHPDTYRERRKAEYGRNRENYKRGRLKALFGIDLDTYNAMLKRQGGVCAICKEPERLVRNGQVVMLAVDHCHDTGKVRALLCAACNRGLGLFRDNPRLLIEAADYVRVHSLISDLLPQEIHNG